MHTTPRWRLPRRTHTTSTWCRVAWVALALGCTDGSGGKSGPLDTPGDRLDGSMAFDNADPKAGGRPPQGPLTVTRLVIEPAKVTVDIEDGERRVLEFTVRRELNTGNLRTVTPSSATFDRPDLAMLGDDSLTLTTTGSYAGSGHLQVVYEGLVAMVPQPNTSRPAPEHPVFPYLLRRLDVCRINQVWAADITYIPLAHGFVYLVAVMDLYSRRVLAWRLSTTLESDSCVRAVQQALSEFGTPEIFNTDQGAQFTAEAFTSVLLERGVKVSMDGKGRYTDNIFVERLWRTLKYEEVYLHAYDGVDEARAGIKRYLRLYNEERSHQALGYQTPAAFYDGLRPAA